MKALLYTFYTIIVKRIDFSHVVATKIHVAEVSFLYEVSLKLQLENLTDDTVGWILKLHLSDDLLINYTTTKSEIEINNLAYSASYVLEIFNGNCLDEMNTTII